jgi:hypothetical protein
MTAVDIAKAAEMYDESLSYQKYAATKKKLKLHSTVCSLSGKKETLNKNRSKNRSKRN